MNLKLSFLQRLVNDEKGATAIEYGLLAALIAVAIIGAVSALGTGLIDTFGQVSAELGTASAPAVTPPATPPVTPP